MGTLLPKFYIEAPYKIKTLYLNRSNYIDFTDRIETSYITTKSAARLIESRPSRSHSFGYVWRHSPIYHRPKQPSAMALYTGKISALKIESLGPIETGYIVMNGVARTIVKKIKKTFKLCNVNGYKKRSILKRITTRSKLPNSYGLFQTYPILKTISNAASWELQFQADKIYQMHPSAMFWAKSTDGKTLEDRSLQPDIQTGRLNLYLEFLIDCDRDMQLENLSLRLEGKVLIGRNIAQTLNLTKGTAFGVRIGVPLRFASKTSTIANDWATWHYLQQLEDQYQDIKALQPIAIPGLKLPTVQSIVFEPNEPSLGIAPKEFDIIKLLEQTNEGVQDIIDSLNKIIVLGPVSTITSIIASSTPVKSGGSGQLTAVVFGVGSFSSQVTWTIQPQSTAIGTISILNGVVTYTAPSDSAGLSSTLRATSVQNSGMFDEINLIIDSSTLSNTSFEILDPGQRVWTLSKVPVNPELSELYLNGQKQRFLYDYSINGQILTWQTLILSPTDYLEINYQCP